MLKIYKVSKENEKHFISLPKAIYKNDNEFIEHLENDIKAVFDLAKNNYLEDGEIMRWVLMDNNKCVGRIAAGLKNKINIGQIGFFECENNQNYSNLLFETAENWLKSKGAKRAQAPVNFGSRDSYWGLLVYGFKRPSYRESYNPTYYQKLIENAGYKEDFKQTTSEICPETFNFERFNKLAIRVLANPDYDFKPLDYKNLNKFAEDFVYIYNEAWKNHDFFKPLTKPGLLKEMKKMKPIAPGNLNWFVYANCETAGFYINVLDVNQIFKGLNGKLNLWGKVKFLLNRSKIDRIRGIVFGVIPAFQNKGLETGMIMKFHEEIIKNPTFKSSELSWIGDFNPKMQSLFDSLGAVTSKMHLTYTKEF